MPANLFDVSDQVVLVSGGSRGIGFTLGQAFAERGAQVILLGREQSTLSDAAAAIESKHAPATIVCDVSQSEGIRNAVAEVVETFGRIDTLLNVAGVNKRQPAENFTEDEYDFILNINLRGAFLMAVEVGKVMLQRGSGNQINIDSLNTYAPLKGVVPYAMSKGGMQSMTRGLATEWGPSGVRVNGLAPGFILTDLTQKLWSEPHMQEWCFANTPLRRLGKAQDLVGTAIFLASEAAGFLTGQTIYVDGGICAGMNWPIRFDS